MGAYVLIGVGMALVYFSGLGIVDGAKVAGHGLSKLDKKIASKLHVHRGKRPAAPVSDPIAKD